MTSAEQARGSGGSKTPGPSKALDPDFWARHTQLPAVIAVFCGGVIGSLARLALSSLQPSATTSWPWATMLVNLTGALLLGAITEWFAQTGKDEGLRHVVRLGLGTGGIGGYTTYSTFVIETDTRFAAHSLALAGTYLVLSVALGLICAGLGIAAGTRLANRRAPNASGPTNSDNQSATHSPAPCNATLSHRPPNHQSTVGLRGTTDPGSPATSDSPNTTNASGITAIAATQADPCQSGDAQ